MHRGIFLNFHQKLVVYYILDYFGILFILDINSVLIEFILLLVAGFTLILSRYAWQVTIYFYLFSRLN